MKAEIPVCSTDSRKLGNYLKMSLVPTKRSDLMDRRWSAAGAVLAQARAPALGLGSAVERAGGSLTGAARSVAVD